MTPHTLYEDAQLFIKKNIANYNTLLDTVKSACKKVEALERQSVKTTYSRGEKQKNKSELKETWKLPKKLLKIQQDQASHGAKNKRRKTWRDLPDVIGVTIVVYYPDQITTILNQVIDELGTQGIELDEPIKQKTEFGYHAVHAVVVSRRGTHFELRCEVQCKTMLHDSWSTKMHDLTYKPMGYLEPRLELLMQAFGDTLERVERQSQAIRDMIMEKWNAESERRRLTHAMLFSTLETARKRPDLPGEAKKIRELIERHRTAIAQAASAEDSIIRTISEKINAFCADNLEEGWILAAMIANFRPKLDLVAFLDHHAEAWLEEAAERLRLRKLSSEQRRKIVESVLRVPLAYISAGNMDLAVDAYDKLLRSPKRYGLSKEAVRHCRFNYANVLVERHYYEPDEHRDGPLKKFQARINLLLKQAGPLGAASKRRPKQQAEVATASVHDTNGFARIAFGLSPQEVTAGIDLCNRARLVAQRYRDELGEKYCELHLRLGWRKLLELEARKPQAA